jgi:hypothetical protein
MGCLRLPPSIPRSVITRLGDSVNICFYCLSQMVLYGLLWIVLRVILYSSIRYTSQSVYLFLLYYLSQWLVSSAGTLLGPF